MAVKLAPLAGRRRKRESRNAIQALNDWLRMGPGRSLTALHRQYAEMRQGAPPTRSLNTLKAWSAKYDWRGRAEEYDSKIEEEKNAHAREIMESGLALEHERVEELKRLAEFLIEQLYEQGEDDVFHNVWMPDVKQIGSGKYAERVNIERFNSAIIHELRGILDDLAKETGGRVRVTSGTGRIFNIDVTKLTNEQLQRIANGEDPFIVLATSGQGGT